MRLVVIAVLALVATFAALAQDTAERASFDRDALPELVASAENALALPSDTGLDQRLSDARLAIDAFRVEAALERADKQARLDEIKLRLEAIGENDAAEVTAERDRLMEEQSALAAEVSALDDDLAAALDLSDRIVVRRRELFSETLFRRQDIGRAFTSTTTGAFGRETAQLRSVMEGWVSGTLLARPTDTIVAGLLILIGILGAIAGTRRLRRFVMPAMQERSRPSYLYRMSSAFARVVLRTFGVAVVASFSFAVLQYFRLIDGVVEQIVLAVLTTAVGIQFAIALLNAVLTPRRAAWRLLDLDDGSAKELFRLSIAVVLVFAFDALFGRVANVMGAPVSVIVVENFVAAIVNGVLLIAIARIRVRPMQLEAAPPTMTATDPEAPSPPRLERWPTAIRVPLLLLGIGLIVAALLGYIGLAQFTAQQIVITGAILGTMYVGLLTARAISMHNALRTSSIGRALERRRDLSDERHDQIGVLIGLAIRVTVILIGLPLILLQWGFRAEEMGSWVANAMVGVQIGSVTISLGGILLGAVVFGLGWLLTRSFQRWLDQSVLERGRVDVGVRNSVRTIVGYVCLALVALFALSIAGVNFAGLAVVAGALSVGIGFGLQNVVSNFVSGLILLAERPFRVGDIVETGSTLGVIQKIAVRATTIETFNKQSVIVPNSDLINGVVSNWTLGDRLTRADIPVGVEYGADPRRVHELLLEIAEGHPLTLRDPAPFIMFNGFGDSSLDFELRFFLANVSDKIATVNEVSYQIFERLKAEGIEIPFPQRDVNVKVEGANDDMPDALVSRIAAAAAE